MRWDWNLAFQEGEKYSSNSSASSTNSNMVCQDSGKKKEFMRKKTFFKKERNSNMVYKGVEYCLIFLNIPHKNLIQHNNSWSSCLRP